MIFEIMKARKGMSLADTVDDLKDALFKSTNDATRGFLQEQLTKLQNATELNETLVNSVKKDIKEKLGVRVEEFARQPFYQATFDAYAKEAKYKLKQSGSSLDFSFRDADLRAIEASEKFNSWYLGGRVRDKADKEMSAQIKTALSEGWTIEKFGEVLEETLGEIKDGYNYKSLAQNTLFRAANLGDVAAYEQSEIEYAKVVAVLDVRTTPVCKNMHGRIIAIADLSRSRDKIVKAYESKDIKKLEKAALMDASWKPGTSTKQAISQGRSLPGYHFGCRTITVAHFMPSGKVNLKTEYGTKLNKDMKENIESFSDLEKHEWYNEMIRKAKDRKLKYNPRDLREDDDHWGDLGAKDRTGYIEKCHEIVEKPDKIWINDYNNDLQLAFERDGRAVVTDKWSVRTVGEKTHRKYKGITGNYGRRIK